MSNKKKKENLNFLEWARNFYVQNTYEEYILPIYKKANEFVRNILNLPIAGTWNWDYKNIYYLEVIIKDDEKYGVHSVIYCEGLKEWVFYRKKDKGRYIPINKFKNLTEVTNEYYK